MSASRLLRHVVLAVLLLWGLSACIMVRIDPTPRGFRAAVEEPERPSVP